MSEVTRNRLGNTSNQYQGHFKKVLCVCSAGVLRSPTMAWILSNEPFNFNTRAVGINDDFALTPVDLVHLAWADEIVCMDKRQQDHITEMQLELAEKHSAGFYAFDVVPVHNLEVPDIYGYRDPKLVEILAEKAHEIFGTR